MTPPLVALDKPCPRADCVESSARDVAPAGFYGDSYTPCRTCSGTGRVALTLVERKARLWDWMNINENKNWGISVPYRAATIRGEAFGCDWAIAGHGGTGWGKTPEEAGEAAVAEIRAYLPLWGAECEVQP